jgi:lipoprotein-anchoring transpeptidase ErfK/SrfK
MSQIIIDIFSQVLHFMDGTISQTYPVSTAKKGCGEIKGSSQTPRGWHIIRAKIGAVAPKNGVFVGRRFTGEIYTPKLGKAYPHHDWILSRILWLSGLEIGKNRLGNCDSMQRYIYIHGCPDEIPIGTPLSKGCVRMRNDDIIELFNLVPPRTRVLIHV